MIKKGVYAAGLSVLNADRTLNIDATIAHASQAIQSGLHGIFFFGSTGQSQLISTNAVSYTHLTLPTTPYV